MLGQQVDTPLNQALKTLGWCPKSSNFSSVRHVVNFCFVNDLCERYTVPCASSLVTPEIRLSHTCGEITKIVLRSMQVSLCLTVQTGRSSYAPGLQCSHLSSLPGRSSAASIRSGRLVAATTVTPFKPSTPSSSVSSWFTTRSVTPVCARLDVDTRFVSKQILGSL